MDAGLRSFSQHDETWDLNLVSALCGGAVVMLNALVDDGIVDLRPDA